jgi:hypothetical protein
MWVAIGILIPVVVIVLLVLLGLDTTERKPFSEYPL